MKSTLPRFILIAFWLVGAHAAEPPAPGDDMVLFEDGFGGLRTGSLGSDVGAHAEYHYLPEVGPKGNWSISTFSSSGLSQRAWRVARHDGQPVMLQAYENKLQHTHPMLVGGDELWRDYTITVRFAPEAGKGRSGLVFRYHNDRCNYFFGVEGPKAVLKMVQHENDFRKPFEKILASQDFACKPGDELVAEVTVAGAHMQAKLSGASSSKPSKGAEGLTATLSADDTTYAQGQIGLVADMPTRFTTVRVTASASERARVAAARAKIKSEEAEREAANPKLVVWKRLKTEGFGVGRNLRFGDLDGDGRIDILFGQVLHHGPKDANSELSCLTAMTLDGKMLWQIGEPDAWKDKLSNDVAFQIHDLDGDGRNEVIYCMGTELIVADGKTGKTKYKVQTPLTPTNPPAPRNRFPRILGDALYFCDFRGQGRAGDLVL
jgi:rhamnogalacturonan endolyase